MKPKRCPACGHLDRRSFDHYRARQLRADGWSYRRIAKALDVTPGAVYHALNIAATDKAAKV